MEHRRAVKVMLSRGVGSVLAPFVAALIAASPGLAQHDHSPYAGMETAEGTSLTPEEVAELRAAEGMRLALPAELNRYPGPRHVLDMAGPLGLSGSVVAEVERVRAAMAEAAAAKGEEVIDAERGLTELFRSGAATESEVDRLAAVLAGVRGELQAIHLSAHLRTRALLDEAQVERYDELRGYAGGAASPTTAETEHTRHPPDRR